jgi:alanine racemase
MTVRADLALVKEIPAGTSVSYGGRWTAPERTTLGLVPVGYGEGVPRAAANRGEVFVAGKRRPIRGSVCMDQVVVDLGGDDPEPGEDVILFGPGTHGEPTADDWAVASDTISWEIITRMGGRLVRRYEGEI